MYSVLNFVLSSRCGPRGVPVPWAEPPPPALDSPPATPSRALGVTAVPAGPTARPLAVPCLKEGTSLPWHLLPLVRRRSICFSFISPLSFFQLLLCVLLRSPRSVCSFPSLRPLPLAHPTAAPSSVAHRHPSACWEAVAGLGAGPGLPAAGLEVSSFLSFKLLGHF